MARFTINTEQSKNEPPTLSGAYTLPEQTMGTMYQLLSSNFTTHSGIDADDPEGDDFKAIKITFIDDSNIDFRLEYNGNTVSVGDEFLLSDIDNNELRIGGCEQCTLSIKYKLSDVGSNSFSSGEATITYHSALG